MTLKIESKEQFEAWMMEHAKPFNWDIRPDGPVFMPEDVRALYDALRPRWLPVSERLPDESMWMASYPCAFRDKGSSKLPHFWSTNCWDNGEWRATPDGLEVTHWFDVPPLPEES